jgi:hypothetical protein
MALTVTLLRKIAANQVLKGFIAFTPIRGYACKGSATESADATNIGDSPTGTSVKLEIIRKVD